MLKQYENFKKIAWKKPDGDIMVSPDQMVFRFFVRTGDSLENIKNVFNVQKTLEIGISGELGFVTEPMPEGEFKNKLDSLDNVLSVIRVMD